MLTHFQYLDSLNRLHLTDTPGMVLFLESRFMLPRKEVRAIVIKWERTHVPWCGGPVCFRDSDSNTDGRW